MASIVTGSFAATGQSPPLVGVNISIKMKFAGTASVDVEEQMPSGNWIKIDTGITADYHKVFGNSSLSSLRLNCTAYTNAVEYVLEA